MSERFTDRARKVMALANQEAQRFDHEYIGTEHILLGLVKEGLGVGANALKNLGVNLHRVRAELEKLIKPGPDMVTMGSLPQTPRAKKVMEYATEEARDLGHEIIGTEHILLGLLRERGGTSAVVLTNLGLKPDEIRQEVLNLLGCSKDKKEGSKTSKKPAPRKIFQCKVFSFSDLKDGEGQMNEFLREKPTINIRGITQSSVILGDSVIITVTIIYTD